MLLEVSESPSRVIIQYLGSQGPLLVFLVSLIKDFKNSHEQKLMDSLVEFKMKTPS